MLRAIVAVASKLHRLRWFLWLLGGVSIVVFLGGIATASGTSLMSLAGMVGVVWAGFLIALAHLFAHREWSPPAADARFATRLRWRIVLIASWAALACVFGLAGLLVLFSLRAFNAYH